MSKLWNKALDFERERLEGRIEQLAKYGALSLKQRVARQRELQANDLRMVENLASFSAEELRQMRILEIGGVRCVSQALFAIKTRLKIALDPLADLWHRYAVTDDTCDYVCGIGENIPLQRNRVDLCWCANVIDHTLSPLRVLQEIRRVLSDDGVLVISCNVFGNWVRPLFPILNRLDSGHPHHFIEATFRQLVAKEFNIQARFASGWGRIYSLKVLLGVICGGREVIFRCSPK